MEAVGALSRYRDVVRAVARAAAMPDRQMAAEVASLIRTHRSYRWVGVYEVAEDEIHVLGWSGPDAPAYPSFPRSAGVCGRAVLSRSVVCVDDVARDPDYLTTPASTRSEIVVPVLNADGDAVGLIDVESADVAAFSPDDRDFLAACVDAAAALWRA